MPEPTALPAIQSLWIGPALSRMERLAIRSFLHHGHPFHLYVYRPVAGVPAGTAVLDAAAILPASAIFRYREHRSYAAFANHFRYRLLHQRGGWWSDTDVVCLRPFTFAAPYVFAAEPGGAQPMVNNGIIKAPAGAPLLAAACAACRAKDPQTLRWGETGPRLLTALIEQAGLARWVEPAEVFCPIGYRDWRQLIEPGAAPPFTARTHGVHLWNEMWRRLGQDKDRRYAAGSLYQTLNRRYPRDRRDRRNARETTRRPSPHR